MIAVAENPRAHAARRQWSDPLGRARILAGQLIAADERRRARLVESHLHLLDFAAAHWSRRYPSLDRDDLRQAAYFGLRRAAELWDPERGVLFSTFAFHWLRDAIQQALPHHLGVIRVPKRPTAPRPIVASFDDADHGGAPEPSAADGADPFEVVAAAEDHARIHSALGKLRNARDREVISMRFGLAGEPPLNLREIGEVLGGISIERVRQLELRALAELRDLLAVE